MNAKPQYDRSAEPRWVTQMLRLFPHPIFALAISIACLLVAAIFTLAALTGGPVAICGVIAIAFGTGAYFIVAATIVRRRNRLELTGLQQAEPTEPVPRPATLTDQEMNHDDSLKHEQKHCGLPPVPTWKLLLYVSTVLVWEAQIAVALLRVLGGIQLDPIWRYSVFGLCLIVTLLAARYGRQDLQRMKMSRGKVELTGKQALIVTVLFVSIGGTAGVVFTMLRDKQ